MGAMFPKTQTGRTVVMGYPIQIPTGTAPRSSTTGSAEIIAKTPKSGMPKVRKKLATFWPVCKCSTALACLAACATKGVCTIAIATKAKAARERICGRSVFLVVKKTTNWLQYREEITNDRTK